MKGKVQQPGSACSGKTSVRSACNRSGRVKGKAKTGKRRVKVKATGIRYAGSRTLSQTDTYVLKMMIWYGVPSMVIHLALTVIRACNLDHKQTLHHVEYFAGKQAVTNAFQAAGLVAMSFERDRDMVHQNLLTDAGFLTAFLYTMKILDGGGTLAAPVCSSWTFMNRGTSKRSVDKPLGNTRLSYIQDANVMVSRVCMLCWLAAARGLMWIIEQPSGSLMEHHPRFQDMIKHMEVHRIFVKMADFSAPSEKGTWLYSNYKHIEDIKLFTTGPSTKHRHVQVSVSYFDKDILDLFMYVYTYGFYPFMCIHIYRHIYT